MYYAAALAPDQTVIKGEGGSTGLALERFRNTWNDHVALLKDTTINHHISSDNRFTPDEFFKRFSGTEMCIMTTNMTALNCFLDTAADGQGVPLAPRKRWLITDFAGNVHAELWAEDEQKALRLAREQLGDFVKVKAPANRKYLVTSKSGQVHIHAPDEEAALTEAQNMFGHTATVKEVP